MTDARPRIVDVETFLAVADVLSLSRAATALNVSKSVVSRRLSRLEATLKSQLLVRTTRRVSLTEEGESYRDDLGDIRLQLDRATERLERRRDKPVGLIRLVMPSYLGASVITEQILPRFIRENPEVSLNVRLTDAGPFAIPKDFDLLLLTRMKAHQLPDSDLRELKLGRLRSGVFASKAYLDQHGRPEQPHDLLEHRCVSYRGRSWRFEKRGAEPVTVQVSGPLTTGSNEVLKAAVLSDLGITYSFATVFRDELEMGLVESVLDDWTEQAGLDLRMLTPGHTFPPLRVRRLAELIRSTLGL